MAKFGLENPTEEDLMLYEAEDQEDTPEMDAGEEQQLLEENAPTPEGPELLSDGDESMDEIPEPDLDGNSRTLVIVDPDMAAQEPVTPPLEDSAGAPNPFNAQMLSIPKAQASGTQEMGGTDNSSRFTDETNFTLENQPRKSPHEKAMERLQKHQTGFANSSEWTGMIYPSTFVTRSITSELRNGFENCLGFENVPLKRRMYSNGNSNNTTESGGMDDESYATECQLQENGEVYVKNEPSTEDGSFPSVDEASGLRKCQKLRDRVDGVKLFGLRQLSRDSLKHFDMSSAISAGDREEALRNFFERTTKLITAKVDKKYEEYIAHVQLQREMETKKIEHAAERMLTSLLHAAGPVAKFNSVIAELDKEKERLDEAERDPSALEDVFFTYNSRKVSIDSCRESFWQLRDDIYKKACELANAQTIQSSRVVLKPDNPLFSLRYGNSPIKRRESAMSESIDLSKTVRTSSVISKLTPRAYTSGIDVTFFCI
ncbi:unnamed protein product [Oikopleura dioica]|uniref:Uncharacterized protein n=1 Tax=Oikopleura dioica TaxID=34765 RepID=E4X6K0_OIKDI|nr:unnamed protein product [Oikopleura dioica]